MSIGKKAEKKSLDFINSTCPTVDKITQDSIDNLLKNIETLYVEKNKISAQVFALLVDDITEHFDKMNYEIKNQVTYEFRDALDSACCEIIDLEDQIIDLDYAIQTKESEIDDLYNEKNSLEQTIAELETLNQDYKIVA